MNKIMSLDIGTKRIGLALSDYLHVLAVGYCCVNRLPEKEAVSEIKKIALENDVKTIVIGIPVNMDGTLGFQAKDCKQFAEKLNDFELVFEDERLTSELAEERLREKKKDFRKDKSLVDIESACIILEQYLSKI